MLPYDRGKEAYEDHLIWMNNYEVKYTVIKYNSIRTRNCPKYLLEEFLV